MTIRELFTNNKLNKNIIEDLLNHPQLSIKRTPVNEFRFSSTLPYVRDGENLYYHPNNFFIDFQYRCVWIRAGVVVAQGGGWHWETEIYKTYDELGIKTSTDLLYVLGKHIPVIRRLPNYASTKAKTMKYIVELENGVWLADWPGDPGRTLVRENAKQYTTEHGAAIALGMARKFRPFKNAIITAVY